MYYLYLVSLTLALIGLFVESTAIEPLKPFERAAILVDLPLETYEKRYQDVNGFDCHETLSYGSFEIRPSVSEADQGRDKSFRIQEKRSIEDEESKVPEFVRDDGFLDDDWF